VKFVVISHNSGKVLIEAAKQLPDMTFDLIVLQFQSSKVKFVAIISHNSGKVLIEAAKQLPD